jgi:hypothetical protein
MTRRACKKQHRKRAASDLAFGLICTVSLLIATDVASTQKGALTVSLEHKI